MSKKIKYALNCCFQNHLRFDIVSSIHKNIVLRNIPLASKKKGFLVTYFIKKRHDRPWKGSGKKGRT